MGLPIRSDNPQPANSQVSPERALKERGGRLDSAPLISVADVFGYILGFILLWLLYTGYQAVSGVVASTNKTISRVAEQAKTIVQAPPPAIVQIPEREPLSVPTRVTKREVGWMDWLNDQVDALTRSVSSLFGASTDDEDSDRRPLDDNDSDPSKDALDSF